MIIYLSFVLIILLLLHVAIRYNKAGKLINKIPGPSPLPFCGNLLMFNGSPEQLWNTINRILDEYYPIVRIWGCKIHAVIIRHPDDMKILLSCKKNIDKCNSVNSSFKNISDGLAISTGEKWRQRRKMIHPAFSPNMLKFYAEIINEHAEHLIYNIKNQNLETVPDLVAMSSKLALGIICEVATGIDLKYFGVKKEEQFRHSFDDFGEVIFYRASRPYLQDWMMKFLSVGRKQESAIKCIREFTNTMIQERREYHEKVGYRKYQSLIDHVECELSSTKRKRLAALDLLLAAEKENLIDKEGVRDEVETFIGAGYETSGIAMTFALMLLAENKAIQDFARDEVIQMLDQTGGVLTIADINNLEYLDRCIKETLRLYPSAPMISRSILETIKLRQYEIPKGTEVIASLFSLHRDPNVWPDPEKFDPDRFLPGNTEERHPFAYLPFGAGPRTCIGYKFAMLELKAVVARILYNFYLEPLYSTVNVKLKLNFTLKPVNPCPVKLIKIDRKQTKLCE